MAVKIIATKDGQTQTLDNSDASVATAAQLQAQGWTVLVADTNPTLDALPPALATKLAKFAATLPN